MNPVLVDTHAHLHMNSFASDRQHVLERAWASGLGAVLEVGIGLESSRKALALAKANPGVWACAGIHPHDAAGWDDPESLRALAREPEVVAIGETGLDFHRNLSPRQDQERAFRQHLRLGVEMDLPVVVHCRDAYREALAIIREEGARRGVMHCFSGNVDDARETLRLGFHLSIAGPITYPKSDRLREVVRFIPMDRLLVESDCPFLAPQAMRGKRNEPAFVYHVARECAAVKGVSLDRLCQVVVQNSQELFGSLLSRF